MSLDQKQLYSATQLPLLSYVFVSLSTYSLPKVLTSTKKFPRTTVMEKMMNINTREIEEWWFKLFGRSLPHMASYLTYRYSYKSNETTVSFSQNVFLHLSLICDFIIKKKIHPARPNVINGQS